MSLFIFLYCIGIYIGVLGQDYQIGLSESAMNKLVQYVIPSITEHVRSQKIDANDMEGILDIRYGPILVRSFTFNMTLLFEEEKQQIDTQIIDLTLTFKPFVFIVEKRMTDNLGITCNTLLTPAFVDWNLAFKFDPSVDDKCSIVLKVDEQSIIIKPGKINIDVQFASDFCQNLFATAAFILDLENNIRNQIIAKMPDIITNDLQTAVNDGLAELRYIEGVEIGLCYTEVSVTGIRITVGGYFVTNFNDIDWDLDNSTISLESIYFDQDIAQFTNAQVITIKEESKALIAGLFVLCVLIAIGIGICISYAICCCIYNPKLKRMEQKNTTSNAYEQEPMIN